MREAICHVRERDPALLGAIAYWGFNIAVLWACFHAFGNPPPLAVIIMGYFVGFLGNLLPLPGGIGGVDGGMIGAFAAFGVTAVARRPGRAGLSHLHVLAADDPRRDRLLPAAPHRRALARGTPAQRAAGGRGRLTAAPTDGHYTL